MSNARDDREWPESSEPRKGQNSKSISSASEEIGQMHYSTENYTTALEYFKKAITTQELKDYPDRFRLRLRISDCLRRKGDFQKARATLDQARAALVESPLVEDLGKIEYREAFILLAQGYYDEALKIGFSAYRRLKHSSEHSEVADIQILLANCYTRLGLAGEAEEFFMDALSSYRRIEDRVGIAYVYNNLGLLHKNACRWQRSLASLSKSLDIAKSLGLTQHLIRVQLNLGIVHGKLRRFTDALSSFTHAATTAERFGDKDKLTKATLMMGRTYVQCGEFAKAEKYIVRAQAMANEYGCGRESALADEFLGELMIARGQLHEGLVNLNNGLRKARKIAPEGDVTAEILRRLGDVHFYLEQYKKSLAYIEEGIEISGNCGELYELGYFYRTKGLVLGKLGDLEEAIHCLETSVDTFQTYGNPFEKAESQQYLGRLYIQCRSEECLLKAKNVLTESIIGFSKLEESQGQLLSQVILATVDMHLNNLDDALLAVYEADRLADEVQNPKFKRLLHILRQRIESHMASTSTRVLDQFAAFGDIQSSTHSRTKLVDGLGTTLKMIADKAGATGGFIAIRNPNKQRFDVVNRENMKKREAVSLLAWYEEHKSAGADTKNIIVTDSDHYPDLAALSGTRENGHRGLIFQALGFEDEDLGCLCLDLGAKAAPGSIGKDTLHFVAAYTSLISISLYDLVRNEKRALPKAEPSNKGLASIVTDNKEMLNLLNLAERVAHSDATVLLQGETGTGKGLIAYAIHLLSDRREKHFVHVNCAALPENLLESELFGHVRGAFTGAIADKDGLLRQAHGGTIFLDEIGKTSLTMQGKLLQFLDTGKVRKVGSNDMLPVDVQVICASKIDLLRLCDEGKFLEDFYYRINDFPLTIPPLRKRKEDIPLLLRHYIEKISSKMGKIVRDFSNEALDCLLAYHWPGNVRELEKVVKRAIILADEGEMLGVQHLAPEVLLPAARPRDEEPRTLKERLNDLERQEIVDALRRAGGNKSQAAGALGISYPNLLAKIRLYNIDKY